MNKKPWTEEEQINLCAAYQEGGLRKARDVFPDRTTLSIRGALYRFGVYAGMVDTTPAPFIADPLNLAMDKWYFIDCKGVLKPGADLRRFEREAA